MKVFVTGASGRIGKVVVKKLASSGYRVKSFDRAEPEQTLPDVEYANGDINDFNFLLGHMKGADAVVHLAALPSPDRGTSQEIFRINVLGTFNVFRTAVENGVKKIVQASSINALGSAYGIKKFNVSYFPIDEEHPSSITDPYSLSKKMDEDIADYFWRRESLSSFSLRFPGVMDTATFQFRHMDKDLIMRAIAELEETGVEERMKQIDEVFNDMDSVIQGWKQGKISEMKDPVLQMKMIKARIILWARKNFWTYLDYNDSALSVLKSLQADVKGSHPLFVNSDNYGTDIDTMRLVKVFFPEVKEFKREIKGTEPAVSIDKAVKMIGFKPEFNIRKF